MFYTYNCLVKITLSLSTRPLKNKNSAESAYSTSSFNIFVASSIDVLLDAPSRLKNGRTIV